MSNERFQADGDVVWRPSPEQIAGSRLKSFMDLHGLPTYEALLRRSTSEPEWFWRAVLEDLGVEFFEDYTQVLDVSRGVQWARWCVGGKLNIVHNCLDKRIGTALEGKVAVRSEAEDGSIHTLTYGELFREVNRCANAFRALGIDRGDRVGLFLPMCPELIVAFFATIKIGAIVLPLFSGYGADAVASRLTDADAALLVTADGFTRRGHTVVMKAVADSAAASVGSLRNVVVVNRGGFDVPMASGRDRHWVELLAAHDAVSDTLRTDAEDPLMIIHTSGTTGRPKGTVHTHCGFPIKTAQDMVHAFDVRESDTMFWVTDMGWMMGPWEVIGTTLLGATMVIYDGALDHPGPDRLWEIVARHGVTVLGVAPTLIRTLMKHGDAPVRAHDVSSLRILGSSGEPWNPAPWRWFFDTVGRRRLPIVNYSGGTEVGGGLVAGNVLTPMKACSFAGPLPGIAADVVDDDGRPVRNRVGELVVRRPWIGMTRGFWRDTERYLEAYWSRFPDTWVHGDWAAIDDDGLWYLVGRSDDTIKVAGKRLGPAEVESVLVEHPAVVEAAAIGVPDETKGQALVCFCVLRQGVTRSQALVDELIEAVTSRLGKPLKPKAVELVPELPRTRSAKVMRRVVRAAYLDEPAGDLSALENPSAVEAIRNLQRQ